MTKIKAFFKKWVLNNIAYKIFSLALAFILWLIILNVTDPDATKTISSIPVTIENEDSVLDGSHIYEIVSGETTSITVTGARSIISSLTSDDFTATADFSELSTTNTVSIDVEITGDMSKYSNKVEITIKTANMVLDIDEITTLKVPVEVMFTGDTTDDEFIDSYSVIPEYVTITAPSAVLEKVGSALAYIDYSEINGSGSIRTDVLICGSDGEEISLGSYGSVDYSSVLVEVEASYIKTVSIYMDDPDTEPADGYTFDSLSYSVKTVTIKGSKELIEGISIIELPSALLDISGATSNVSITVSVSDYLPDGVTVYADVSKVVITANIIETETEAADEEEETSSYEEDTSEETSEEESETLIEDET